MAPSPPGASTAEAVDNASPTVAMSGAEQMVPSDAPGSSGTSTAEAAGNASPTVAMSGAEQMAPSDTPGSASLPTVPTLTTMEELDGPLAKD